MKRDIRFLVTNHCNYQCFFCHNEGVESTNQIENELDIDDYLKLYLIHSDIEKWNGVTISGGEPLVYKNIFSLCEMLYNAGAEITLVTNGFLIEKNLAIFQYIKRVNISIHVFDKAIYERTVGRKNVFDTVVKGLRMLRARYPELDIRLNVTPTLINWNNELLEQLMGFGEDINATIKFTELFPNTDSQVVPKETIEEYILKRGYRKQKTVDRATYYSLDSYLVVITQCTCSKALEFKEPANFCRNTHELYVNHTGHFLLCRLGQEQIDFYSELKAGDEKALRDKLECAYHRISNEKCCFYLSALQ